MYMSRFGVKNYKCLGEIDIPLTPIHVLIGQNDAGKTSLLEAMEAFCASSEKPLPEIFPGPWSGRELVRHGAPKSCVELSGAWGENERGHRYGFAVDFSTNGKDCSTQGDWAEIGGEKGYLQIERQTANRTSICLLRSRFEDGGEASDTLLEGWTPLMRRLRKAPGIGSVFHFLKQAHRYMFDAKAMAVPAAINLDQRFHLEADGFGLPTLLGDILEHDAEHFVQLSKAFCGHFPQFIRVRLETERAYKRELKEDGPPVMIEAGVGRAIRLEMHDGQSIRAQQASDGAILFLGFLALAYLPDPPNLLLIEEPENGIYPLRLREVLTLLKQLVARTEGVRFPQIIMTTHSPYVLSEFEPEEVTFLRRPPGQPDGPVEAKPMRDAPNIRERLADGFYLGELWYNVSEEDLFGDS